VPLVFPTGVGSDSADRVREELLVDTTDVVGAVLSVGVGVGVGVTKNEVVAVASLFATGVPVVLSKSGAVVYRRLPALRCSGRPGHRAGASRACGSTRPDQLSWGCQLSWMVRLSVGRTPQSPGSHVYWYVIEVPGSPDVRRDVCTSVGLVNAATGRESAVGTAMAHTIARTTTPAALRMPLTLSLAFRFPRATRQERIHCSDLHQVTDQVADAESLPRPRPSRNASWRSADRTGTGR